MPRTPRSAQTREATQHPQPATRARGKLYVDPHRVPKGWSYRWVRESTRNEPDPSNITEAQIIGWLPVPAADHPELVPPPLPGEEGNVSQVIRRGGLMLMKRLTKDVQADRRALREENMASIQGIAAFTDHADALMPRFDRSGPVQIEQVSEAVKFQD